MNNLNTVLIEGQLVRNPERPQKQSNHSVCRMTLANNRYYNKGGEWVKETSFFTVYVYGTVADACYNNLKKGRGIRVVGRLKQYNRTNAFGEWIEQVYIAAEHIEFQPVKKTADTPVDEPGLPPGTQKTSSNLQGLEGPQQEMQRAEATKADEAPCDSEGMDTTLTVEDESAEVHAKDDSFDQGLDNSSDNKKQEEERIEETA